MLIFVIILPKWELWKKHSRTKSFKGPADTFFQPPKVMRVKFYCRCLNWVNWKCESVKERSPAHSSLSDQRGRVSRVWAMSCLGEIKWDSHLLFSLRGVHEWRHDFWGVKGTLHCCHLILLTPPCLTVPFCTPCIICGNCIYRYIDHFEQISTEEEGAFKSHWSHQNYNSIISNAHNHPFIWFLVIFYLKIFYSKY